VPDAQQKTIHKHLAAAKKRQGVDGESQYSISHIVNGNAFVAAVG
jgi:hypothetical protein